MQRLTAASCLLLALLAGSARCPAAERLRVAVVQTHTGVKLGANPLDLPADSDPVWTRCDAASGTYSRELGFHCGGFHPLALPLAGDPAHAYSLFYDVSVIMPDQARLLFHCSTILEPSCEGFPSYPDSTSVTCTDFVDDGVAYEDCTATGVSNDGIGTYQVALRGDKLTIFGSNWQRSYQQYGTWKDLGDAKSTSNLGSDLAPNPPEAKPHPESESGPILPAAPILRHDPQIEPLQVSQPDPPRFAQLDLTRDAALDLPGVAAPDLPQEPKPTQEAKPAPETKPALPPDANSASPKEAGAPSARETKPALPPTDTNPASSATPPRSDAAAAPGVLNPVVAADRAIDPQIIEQAKAGDSTSQYKLGYDYFLGKGVPLDYVQAAVWWRKAADQGLPDAQNNLGVLYNSGKGVPQSYEEAYFWQNLAASRATTAALQVLFTKNRDESGSKLWFITRNKVQQRAAKWAAEHPVPPRSHEPEEVKRGEYP